MSYSFAQNESEIDRNLVEIGNSLDRLKDQAGAMGTELDQHNILIGTIDEEIVHVDSGLQGGIKKINKIMDKPNVKCWCIVFLVITAVILLIAIIFV